MHNQHCLRCMLTKMIFHHDPLPLVEKAETEFHGLLKDEGEDEEETLSFCEFSINCNDSDLLGSSNSSRESSQYSTLKSSEDGFEFFSQEWSINQSCFFSKPQSQNIIFCGKLISNKDPTSENTQMVHYSVKLGKQKKMRTRIFRWKWKWSYFSSSHKTKPQKKVVPGSYKSLKTEPDQLASKQRWNERKRDLSARRISMFTTAPSRWYLIFFGVTTYKTKMELRDIKMRQSRSRRSSSFHNDERTTVCMNKSKGFWSLLRTLSCGITGDHCTNNEVVRPSTMAAGRNPLF